MLPEIEDFVVTWREDKWAIRRPEWPTLTLVF